MRRVAILAAVLLFLPQCAGPLTSMMGVPTEGVIASEYKDDEQVRVASYDRYEIPLQVAFDEVVAKVKAKGYNRFALIRKKCETTYMQNSGVRLGTGCVLWAQMLGSDDVAEPKGKSDQVEYYRIFENGVVTKERQ